MWHCTRRRVPRFARGIGARDWGLAVRWACDWRLARQKQKRHARDFGLDDSAFALLGIGEIEDLLNGIERGIDLFDCAAPTRWARNGSLMVSHENAKRENFKDDRLTIANARFALDAAPIDATCECLTCKNYSRAYLHHLHRAKELSYYRLATIHNLHFILRFMERARAALRENNWEKFRAAQED
ncbi:MAG: hypothetical protein DCC52_14770 [Chloroflexi bacterium]|nr:MAG: hypothetical protein DCC52_14770 [Chloroflexota bacterium]